jgi:hypothetical protein
MLIKKPTLASFGKGGSRGFKNVIFVMHKSLKIGKLFNHESLIDTVV